MPILSSLGQIQYYHHLLPLFFLPLPLSYAIHQLCWIYFLQFAVLALKQMTALGEIQLTLIPANIIAYIFKISTDSETTLTKLTYTYPAWLNSMLGHSAGLILVSPSPT
jgi:hypothetical protein